MKTRKLFLIPAALLTAAITIYLLTFKTLSENLRIEKSRTANVVFALAAVLALGFFALSFMNEITFLSLAIMMMEMCALFFILQSILRVEAAGGHNIELALGLGLNCIALCMNNYRMKKMRGEG